MPARVYELRTSRALSHDPTNGSAATLDYLVTGEADEPTALAAVEAEAPLVYEGLWLLKVEMDPQGGDVFKAVAQYGVPRTTPGAALPSQVVPTGADAPGSPQSPEEDAALGPEWSFSTTGATKKFTQARHHLFSLAASGKTAPNHKGAINVREEVAEGVDVVVPKLEFSTRRRVAGVSLKYIRQVSDITGTVNAGEFLSFPKGELLFLGADGDYKTPTEGWEITYRFARGKARRGYGVAAVGDNPNDEIAPGILLGGPDSKGDIQSQEIEPWDYLWVEYRTKPNTELTTGGNVLEPIAAHVERVYEYADFRDLGFGGNPPEPEPEE